jgi:hypothetical protein
VKQVLQTEKWCEVPRNTAPIEVAYMVYKFAAKSFAAITFSPPSEKQ